MPLVEPEKVCVSTYELQKLELAFLSLMKLKGRLFLQLLDNDCGRKYNTAGRLFQHTDWLMKITKDKNKSV